MHVDERDPHTGHKTTGHEWNGIKELNTPVPKIVWFFLIVTALFSVVYWVLMPAWPLGVTYTKGILGIEQHTRIDEDVREARMERSVWASKIKTLNYAEIETTPALMMIVQETGSTLFGDNCSVCHGSTARGGPGFPNLADKSFLWGGSADEIAETIRVGVNSTHDDTHMSQMMAFGRDQILNRDEILNVVSYIQSLSALSSETNSTAENLAAGKTVFVENCASCHGENGKGLHEMGAPDLTDGFWIYGGDRQSIYTTVWHGRSGNMPSWEARLTPVERKILTLYVLNHGKAEH